MLKSNIVYVGCDLIHSTFENMVKDYILSLFSGDEVDNPNGAVHWQMNQKKTKVCFWSEFDRQIKYKYSNGKWESCTRVNIEGEIKIHQIL